MNEHLTNINPPSLADELLMIAPREFQMNVDTVATNSFQNFAAPPANLAIQACREFEQFVELLLKNNVKVHVFEGESDCNSPDRIYPNNWISFHEHRNVLYPMQPLNRRSERNQPVLDCIPKKYTQRELMDWTMYENEQRFLEGTGSLVLDRKNRFAFASLSARTHESLVRKWCEVMDYESFIFVSHIPGSSDLVYHTNVVMSILQTNLVIGMDCIIDESIKVKFIDYAERFNKSMVVLSSLQISEFAANILEFNDAAGAPCIAMSLRAMRSLLPGQLKVLEKAGNILPVNLEYIERYGGGSARCMLTELF